MRRSNDVLCGPFPAPPCLFTVGLISHTLPPSPAGRAVEEAEERRLHEEAERAMAAAAALEQKRAEEEAAQQAAEVARAARGGAKGRAGTSQRAPSR